MAGIVCAIRGGPGSQPTILESIKLAGETKLQLYFLYVVNLDFLAHTMSSRVQTISKDMRQMGEIILDAAQAQAASEGIEAVGMVRHGSVGEEINTLCHEVDADYLVLGRPHVQREDSLFTHDLLAEFIAQFEERTGAKVVLPPDGDA